MRMEEVKYSWGSLMLRHKEQRYHLCTYCIYTRDDSIMCAIMISLECFIFRSLRSTAALVNEGADVEVSGESGG